MPFCTTCTFAPGCRGRIDVSAFFVCGETVDGRLVVGPVYLETRRARSRGFLFFLAFDRPTDRPTDRFTDRELVLVLYTTASGSRTPGVLHDTVDRRASDSDQPSPRSSLIVVWRPMPTVSVSRCCGTKLEATSGLARAPARPELLELGSHPSGPIMDGLSSFQPSR